MYLCVYMYACVKEAFSLSWESDSWLLSPPSLASYVSPRRAPLPTLTGLLCEPSQGSSPHPHWPAYVSPRSSPRAVSPQVRWPLHV